MRAIKLVSERVECGEEESEPEVSESKKIYKGPEAEKTHVFRTLRQEIPFEAGSVVIVSEISLELDKGSDCSDAAWSKYIKDLSVSIRKIGHPDVQQPEKMRALFEHWTQNIKQVIESEEKREITNVKKVEILKELLLQVKAGELLFENGDYKKAMNYLNGAIDTFYPAREFPDDPTLGLMIKEMAKAFDFVTPLAEVTGVGKLARIIKDKVSGTIKDIRTEGLYKRVEANEEEVV